MCDLLVCIAVISSALCAIHGEHVAEISSLRVFALCPRRSIAGGGGRHFDISSGNGWLFCALLFFLCKGALSELSSPAIQTQMQALVFGTTLAARVARCQKLSLVPHP